MQKNMKARMSVTGVLAVCGVLLCSVPAQAALYSTWTNGAGDNDFTNPANWDNGLPGVDGRNGLTVNMAGANKAVYSTSLGYNFSPLKVGTGGDGEFEQTGGDLLANNNQNDATFVGQSGYTGTATLGGNSAVFRRLSVGSGSGSTGTLYISSGDVTTQKPNGVDGSSLEIGNGGTGLCEISGGSLNARGTIYVGSSSTFSIVGSGASSIACGGASAGKVVLKTGSTLKLEIDSGGLTPIGIGNSIGTATLFEDNAILDVSFEAGYVETNAWLVMETQGIISNNGLIFAGSVTADWAFGIFSNELWVAYGGAPMGPTTNLYVNTDVAEVDWYFFDYDGNSTFTSSDPSGYSVVVANGSQDGIFPVEVQQFPSGFDMSEIGQKLTAEFDVEMNVMISSSFDKDFRFAFFDTTKNCQLASMNDLGVISGSYMTLKIGDEISYNNGNGGVFVDGDYAKMCILYSSGLGSTSGTKDTGLAQNELNHFKYTIERVGENEISMECTWMDSTSTSTISTVLDETTTTAGLAEYIPAGGYESFDGFALQIHERYSGADYTLSNFDLSYSAPLPAGFGYGIFALTKDSAGDVTLTLSNLVIGATYVVKATDDLINNSMAEVGSYVAEEPGIIVVPAADIAPYIGDTGFVDVELPVTVFVD